MWKKISQILSVLIFVVIFALVFGGEYWDFQTNRKQEVLYIHQSEDHKENFTTEILETLDEVILHTTPDLELLNYLTEQISSAQEKVYVGVYIFTEKRLRDEIISAHKRGIDVKILLENNPYKAPYLNDAHHKSFLDSWIDVRWSDPLNYSLNHAKILLIDDRAFVSTWNFSYSLFKYNRDFLLEIYQDDIVEALKEVFDNDFNHIKIGSIHDNLVLSPEYSRIKLSEILLSWERQIDMYFPYIADDDFQEILFNIAQDWVNIRFIVSEDFYDENPEVVSEYKQYGIDIRPTTWPKLHAKSILVDSSYLYIWSINFSRFSFDENREVGIILEDLKVIENFQEVFESDWQ